jgi:phage/plasmid-like protein (TIGR03299 family)
MAHELEIIGTQANMLYVGETPWHGLGVRFNVAPTIQDVIVAIRADRRVEMRRLSLDGVPVDAWASVRCEDDGTTTVLGAGLGARYEPMQDADALMAMAPLIDTGAATIETAGYLRGGRMLFACARLADFVADVVKGDMVRGFAALSHAHDGSLGIHCGVTDVRIVCRNTQRAALRKDGANMIKLRHTKGAAQGVGQIAGIIAREREAFGRRVGEYRELARRSMTTAQLKAFVERVFPAAPVKGERVWTPPAGVSLTDAMLDGYAPPANDLSISEVLAETEKRSRAADEIIRLFEEGRGNELPGVRGTAYAAFNATTEYLSHLRGRSDDARLIATNYGEARRTTEEALDVLLERVQLLH